MIISSAPMFGIGSSGLRAATDMIKVSSNNIANADTPGFVRSDVVFSERVIRAGVDASVMSRYDANIEGAKNVSAGLIAQDAAMTTGMSALEVTTRTANVGSSWGDFVSAVYDFRQRGNPTGNKANVDSYGSQVAKEYNAWTDRVAAIKADYEAQMVRDQARAVQIQVQLATVGDPTTQSALREEFATLQGKMQGTGDIVTKIIPDLTNKANIAMDAAMAKVNSEMGMSPFGRNLNGKVTYDASQVTGPGLASSSIASDSIAKVMDQVMQQIGIITHQTDVQAASDSALQKAALDAFQSASGVNITDEAVKLKRAQAMYEACAKCIQVEDSNFKSLLAIM